MGLSLSPLQVFLAVPEFRFRRNYLERNGKLINDTLKGLSNAELALIRSMVFPLDRNWPPGTHLRKKFAKALDSVVGHPQNAAYFKDSQQKVMDKLTEWNTLARLSKPEFTRKMEGAGKTYGLTVRDIKPYGISFVDFVEFCRIYENVSVLKIMRETVPVMNQKKWTGVITPKMCICLLLGKKIIASDDRKIRELDIE